MSKPVCQPPETWPHILKKQQRRLHSLSEDMININVAKMNFESLKAWINCCRRLLKVHLYSMEGSICNTPDKIWQVTGICNVPKFCMQWHIFVIAISGFFSQPSIISSRFLLHFPSRFWRGTASTLCRIGARSFRSYTLDFVTSQRLALLSTFLQIMSNASSFIIMHLSMLSPRGGGGPRAYVGHLTFQKNL